VQEKATVTALGSRAQDLHEEGTALGGGCDVRDEGHAMDVSVVSRSYSHVDNILA
jgi:hypothetical protein